MMPKTKENSKRFKRSHEYRFRLHQILGKMTPQKRSKTYMHVFSKSGYAMSNIKAQVYMRKEDTRRPNFDILDCFATYLGITIDELKNEPKQPIINHHNGAPESDEQL